MLCPKLKRLFQSHWCRLVNLACSAGNFNRPALGTKVIHEPRQREHEQSKLKSIFSVARKRLISFITQIVCDLLGSLCGTRWLFLMPHT